MVKYQSPHDKPGQARQWLQFKLLLTAIKTRQHHQLTRATAVIVTVKRVPME